MKNESLFLLALLSDEDLRKSLSEEDVRKCFDYNYYTKMLMQFLKEHLNKKQGRQ